jgi:hypothetical protein
MTACTAHTPGLSRAVYRVGSMPWLGHIAELSIEIGLMLNIRLARNESTVAFQAANAELKSILCEDLAGELPEVLH